MGLGHFVAGLDDAAKNVGKGLGTIANHTLNPTKWDDTADFIGKTGGFVGKYGDDAAKIGWQIAKDQINPMKADFWLNAGTLALSAATGGAAAAPIMAGRAALAARTAKGIDTAVDVARAGSAIADVAKAGSTAAKAVEGVGAVGKAKAAYEAGNVVRSASPAIQKLERGIDAIASSRTSSLWQGAREAVGMQPLSTVARGKVGLSNKIMQAGAGEAGIVRTTLARKVAGQAAVKPSLRVGEAAAKAGNYADDAWRVSRLTTRANQARQTVKGVEVAADPKGAAIDYAMEKTSAGSDFKGDTKKPLPNNNAVGAVKSFDPLSQPMAVNPSTSSVGTTSSSSYQAGRGFSSPTKGISGAVSPDRSLTSSSMPDVYDPYKNLEDPLEQPMEVRDPYKKLSPAGGR